MDKYTSLLQKLLNNGRKKFYDIGPWSVIILCPTTNGSTTSHPSYSTSPCGSSPSATSTRHCSSSSTSNHCCCTSTKASCTRRPKTPRARGLSRNRRRRRSQLHKAAKDAPGSRPFQKKTKKKKNRSRKEQDTEAPPPPPPPLPTTPSLLKTTTQHLTPRLKSRMQ